MQLTKETAETQSRASPKESLRRVGERARVQAEREILAREEERGLGQGAGADCEGTAFHLDELE